MRITRHIDPGHSWFEVKRSVIADLKLLDKISGYSYQKGGMVYLEEDCDADIVLSALEANHVYIIFDNMQTNRESWVRDCDRFINN